MTEAVFAAEPSRLLIAAAAGIVLLLLLIIKFKIHPILSLLISALFIGLGAGMPVPTLVSTVEKGAGETLQGIALGITGLVVGAGSVLVANMLNVDLGVMIAVGVPVGILSLIFVGILWSKFIGSRINTGLPLVLVAFLIAALIRASVSAAVVAMTMAAGIMAAMPGVAGLSPVYLAAMICAIVISLFAWE